MRGSPWGPRSTLDDFEKMISFDCEGKNVEGNIFFLCKKLPLSSLSMFVLETNRNAKVQREKCAGTGAMELQ